MKIGIDITDIGTEAKDIDFNALVSGLTKEVKKLLGTTGRPPNVTLSDFADIEVRRYVENVEEIDIEEVDTTPTVPRFTEEQLLEMVWEELDQGGANRSNDVHDAIMCDIKRDNPYLHHEYLFCGEGIPTHSEVNVAFKKIYQVLGISESILSTVQAGHVGAEYKQLALFLAEPLTWAEFKTRL